ncbi:hypothetical protein LCM20_08740 [Halobacillus litoralis]|uniref:hypothetical protein n=1 Tax=Halobacillus litoralis TaxID=45668 RepID=UPI001CD622D3|nr:hypothetical protein [Halobacillus litoralis]MCA0970672.1 hypothetical protein [Halobacillus litoralis]
MKTFTRTFLLMALTAVLILAAGCTTAEDEGVSANESVNDQENTNESADEADPTDSTESTEDASEENIRTVLQNLLTGPDNQLQEANESFESADEENFEQAAEKRVQYYKEKFKPYMSERLFENFMNTNGGEVFLLTAYRNDYQIKAETITFEESEETEGSYNFTVEASYKKGESSESETVEVRGLINTNDEGKVTRVHYYNPEDLRSALE